MCIRDRYPDRLLRRVPCPSASTFTFLSEVREILRLRRASELFPPVLRSRPGLLDMLPPSLAEDHLPPVNTPRIASSRDLTPLHLSTSSSDLLGTEPQVAVVLLTPPPSIGVCSSVLLRSSRHSGPAVCFGPHHPPPDCPGPSVEKLGPHVGRQL